MDFFMAYAAVAVFGLLAASYTDLKERIVPNELSFGLLFIGLGLHVMESVSASSFTPLLMSLGGAAIAFVFSLFIYKAGAWAGGDVKLFTAMGALLPLPIGGFLSPAPIYEFPLFPFMILINSVLVAFPFIMLYVFWKTFMEEKLRAEFKTMIKQTITKGLIFAGSLFGLSSMLVLAGLSQLISLPILFGIAFLPDKMRKFLAFILFLVGFAISSDLSAFAFLLSLGMLIGGFFEALTHGLRALKKEVPIDKLSEGMIAAELVYVKEGKAKKLERSWLEKLRSPILPETVVSDLSAAGLSVEQITQLKKLHVKTLLVKESIPMIPILLLGGIVSLVVGDLAWYAMNSL